MSATDRVKTKAPRRRNPARTASASSKQKPSNSNVFDSSDDTELDAKCKFCSKDLPEGSQAISCERCTQWVCQECAKLDDPTYLVLTSRQDLHWYCSACELDALQAVQNDAQIEERCREFLTKYEDRLDAVEELLEEKADKSTVDNLGSQVLTMNDQIKNMAQDIVTLSKKIDTVRFEPSEKEKRRNNIVIRGIPETTNISDADKVQEILQAIGCDTVQPTEITRLGKPPRNTIPASRTRDQESLEDQDQNNPTDTRSDDPTQDARPAAETPTNIPHRPVRCVLQSVQQKTTILRAAPQIRKARSENFDHTRIFIVPDQTLLERQEDLALRKRLRERRDASPEKNYVIRGRKIVPRGSEGST